VGLGINSRWTTNLQVGGFADAPRFTGGAELVRGDYDFAGRNFRLDRGTIRFRGESPPNPQLDIRASAQVQGLDANVLVQGTGLKTAIAAGKYLTRKLFVEVVTDGQGYSATRVEYQMTRWLSLLSTVSTVGRSSASVRVSKDY